MAGQEDLTPNYNYTFSTFDSMNVENLAAPSEGNMSMFPIDYRQYFENPVFPSSSTAPENNFEFHRAQYNSYGPSLSSERISHQVTEDNPRNPMRATETEQMSENVRVLSGEGNVSVESNESTAIIPGVSKTVLSKNLTAVSEGEVDRKRAGEKSTCGKGNINEGTDTEKSNTESYIFTSVKKEVESDTEQVEDLEESENYKETNGEIVSKKVSVGDCSNVSKDECITNDNIGVGELDDEGNSSDVSDTSTIIEDEIEINDKLKTKGKTPKVRLRPAKDSRKKPRKQSVPKPVKPADKKEFTCETCGKVVQSLRALIKHKNLHTDKYKCEECNKIFNSEVSLKNHHKVHSGFVGSEVCNVCDKTFYDKSSLNKHTLSVHMGIKNFQCEFCSLSFFARKTYEEHVRVHTGERPFKCTQCPKSYKRIADLNHHLRLHKGEVSHTCEKCGEGFRRVSELNRHMAKHTDENTEHVNKPKRCTWCGLNFATTKALNKHFNEHMETLGASKIDAPNPVQFVQDKLKLVDEIVQDLGTNLIGSDISNIRNERILPTAPDLEKDLNIAGEPRLNMAVFPYQGLDLTYRNIAAEQFQRIGNQTNVLSSGTFVSEKALENYKRIEANPQKTFDEDRNTIELPVSDQASPQEKVAEHAVNAVKMETAIKTETNLEGSVQVNDIFSEGKENDCVKSEVELDLDYDDENDDYAGDTDVEDFNYVMNSSPMDKEKLQKKVDEITSMKKEASPDEFEDDKEEDINMDSRDDEKKDPDFLPSEERSRKRKAALPKRKVMKKKLGKKEGDLDGEAAVDDADGEEGKKGKVRRKPNSGTKAVVYDASMDLDKLKCLQCGKFFAKKVSLIKHMNLHRGTYSCEVCGKCFSTKRSLEIHVDNHEGRKVNTAMCNVCDKAFYDASSLNKHVKTVHMDYKPFPCTMCDRRFSENKTLVEHLRVHTGERPFACEVCGKTYKRASELNFHLRKHNGEVNLNCPECGKGFMRMGQLRQHMMMRHDKERPFRCFLCAKTFPTHPMLKDHQKIHVNQRKHVCERCGYKFHTRSKLEKHLKRKTDCQLHIYKNMNGMFVCKYCYGEFSTVEDRKAHINEVHKNDAAFPCEVCGKHFRRSQALKIHLKIHFQVRDYKCTVCNAAFIQRHHLTQHIATHTGSRPYQCNICLKNFAHNATLYNHMKHH